MLSSPGQPVAPWLSLGEDAAGTLRVWAEAEEVSRSALMRRMFSPSNDTAGLALAAGGRVYTTPLRVKKALAQTLLDAGVPFLTGAYAWTC